MKQFQHTTPLFTINLLNEKQNSAVKLGKGVAVDNIISLDICVDFI
jgi:hypothetical protein